MLLVLAIVLLILAIAGGVIIHPVLFVLALVALAVYFSDRRGGRLQSHRGGTVRGHRRGVLR